MEEEQKLGRQAPKTGPWSRRPARDGNVMDRFEVVVEEDLLERHPAVVRRPKYTLVRGLLAVTTTAVVALTVAVVILADVNDEASGMSLAEPIHPINYGGFSPNGGRPLSAPLPR
jgi:hypothetical protein